MVECNEYRVKYVNIANYNLMNCMLYYKVVITYLQIVTILHCIMPEIVLEPPASFCRLAI